MIFKNFRLKFTWTKKYNILKWVCREINEIIVKGFAKKTGLRWVHKCQLDAVCISLQIAKNYFLLTMHSLCTNWEILSSQSECCLFMTLYALMRNVFGFRKIYLAWTIHLKYWINLVYMPFSPRKITRQHG